MSDVELLNSHEFSYGVFEAGSACRHPLNQLAIRSSRKLWRLFPTALSSDSARAARRLDLSRPWGGGSETG